MRHRAMTRFYVVTPEYGRVDVILDDGTGPMEYTADVIEIEAETARDAIALGVNEMLKDSRWRDGFHWCKDARRDGVSPYGGVRAIPVSAEELEMR